MPLKNNTCSIPTDELPMTYFFMQALIDPYIYLFIFALWLVELDIIALMAWISWAPEARTTYTIPDHFPELCQLDVIP